MTGIAAALAGLVNPALRNLPAVEWVTRAEARAARQAAIRGQRDTALDQIEETRLGRILAPVDPDATEGQLRELARRRAELMLDRIAELAEPVTLEWLNAQVTALEARELPPMDCNGGPYAEQLEARVKRACCRHWWTRNVRRAATRKREAREQAAGRVSVRTAPYVSDETAARYVRQGERNRAILESTEIESADGELLTLWAAMQASTSNPAIRRGELMTRIKGAEQWAAARGMVGLFTTNTLPSRFHATHHGGGRNAAFDGSTPRDGQGWLCRTWARARAALHRERVQFFGFRVAEPHHDGCPHWHMLLFVDKAQAEALQATMRRYWLADAGTEPGAAQHRFKAVQIDPAKGDAAGYVAKYIAKNIDDAGAVGAEGHRDEAGGEQIEIAEAGGGKARRVMAWASAWGIRQFQALGQPPVTVWRELRRVDAQAAQGASPAIRAAHAAVNRTGDQLACWRSYLDAQGGAMQGRAQRVRLFVEHQRRDGLYGPTEAERIVGVHDVLRPGEVVLSSRKAWRPRGTWTANDRDAATVGDWGGVRDWLFARPKAAQPWTRVNNCTQRGGIAELMASGIVGATQKREPGGNLKDLKCPKNAPSPSSLPPWLWPSPRPRPNACP